MRHNRFTQKTRPRPVAPSARTSMRALAAGVTTVLVAGLLSAGGVLVTATPAVAAPGDPIVCTEGVYYAVDGYNYTPTAILPPSGEIVEVDAATGDTIAVGVFPAPDASANPRQINALAIPNGGGSAYALRGTAVAGELELMKYTSATDSAEIIATVDSPHGFLAGAIDPTTGYFWWGGSTDGGWSLSAYDLGANESLGVQLTTPTEGTGTRNGDIAFDNAGNLYLVSSASAKEPESNELLFFNHPVSGEDRAGVLLAYLEPDDQAFNGIAFGADGYLYSQASVGNIGPRQNFQLDPATGEIENDFLLDPENTQATDLASCASPSTIEVRKNIESRDEPEDQFGLSITGNGVEVNGTGLTTGSDLGPQTGEDAIAGPVIALPGETFTIAETGESGADLDNYVSSYVCLDRITTEVVTSGDGISGEVTFPAGLATGASVVCTFLNAADLAPEYVVSKAVDKATALPGEVVTYTVTVKNTGRVDYTADAPASFRDDLSDVLSVASYNNDATEDAKLVGENLVWEGPLAVGASVNVTYSVTIDDPVEGDYSLRNTVIPTGTGGSCEDDDEDNCATVTLIQGYTVSKVSDNDTTFPGDTVRYTVTVTNIGEVDYTDEFPASFTDDLSDVLGVATYNDDVSAGGSFDDTDNTLRWQGPLAVGESINVTYSVTVDHPVQGNPLLENIVTPTGPGGYCEDFDNDNCETNTPIGQVAISKSVSASSDPVEEGTELTYTLTFDNQGAISMDVDYTDILTDVLDDADLTTPPVTSDDTLTVSEVENGQFTVTGPLGAGETVTVTYTVTVKAQEDRGNNSAENFLIPTGDEPPSECLPLDPDCTVTPLPFIEPVKSVDPESGTTVVAGQELTYTLTFTNSGGGAGTVNYTDYLAGILDDAELMSGPTASDPALTAELGSDDDTIVITGELAAGQTVTVTYVVVVLPDFERGDNVLGNFLVKTGENPPTECVEGSPLCTENPVPQIKPWKGVAADSTPVRAGTVLTYTLYFENSGAADGTADYVDTLAHVLDDADVTTEPTSEDGLTVERVDDVISITGIVPAGETYTVTYQVTVKPDGLRGDNLAANFLLPSGEDPPSNPVCQPTDTERPDCTSTPIGLLAISKSVSASSDPVEEGTELTYTLTFDNQGAAPVDVDHTDILTDVLDDADLTTSPVASDDALTVSEVKDGQFTVTGELGIGETVTVTYTVTVKAPEDRGNNSADNFLIPTGDEPPIECLASDPACTVTPLPNVSSQKVADPASGETVLPGEEVTYVLTFRNTGQAAGPVDYQDDITDVLDDADLTGAPVASDAALSVTDGSDGVIRVTGTLEPGQEVTVTYVVRVKEDGDRRNNLLANFLIPSGQEPPAECETDNPNCTEHPIPLITDSKSVDPASGTPVVTGQELIYTLTFRNEGQGPGEVDKVDDLTHILDDADMIVEPVSSNPALTVIRTDARMTITGTLAAGQKVTVTYTVKVRAMADRGDSILANFLLTPDDVPPTEPICTPGEGEYPDCTTNAVGELTTTKSVDPESGTTVGVGAELTYTLSFTNVGAASTTVDYIDYMAGILDNADIVGDIQASEGLEVAGPKDGQLHITGGVEPGETATVVYSVRVVAYDAQGDHQLANFLTPAGQEPATECVDTDPLCTVNPIAPPKPGGGLTNTGGTVPWIALGGGLIALLLGAGLLLAARRRKNAEADGKSAAE